MSDFDITIITDGLEFPEGPIAMLDGTVVLVEMFGGRITRVHPDGSKETVAELPGGPNGLAVGPDGAFYVCNNGGSFTPTKVNGLQAPGGVDHTVYRGGCIQRVDPASGAVTTLYAEFEDGRGRLRPLRGPNDLVFDAAGGFWFTDHGVRDFVHARTADLTGIYYAHPDGSKIVEAVYPTESPNGIGLSPDGTMLYWAETHTGRVYQRPIESPGVLGPAGGASRVLCGLPGYQLFDSLAVDGEGHVCVATLINGGITVIEPGGAVVAHLPTGDRMTTNICFGDRFVDGGDDRDGGSASDGSGEYREAFITLSGTGRLAHVRWPWKGLRLNWL